MLGRGISMRRPLDHAVELSVSQGLRIALFKLDRPGGLAFHGSAAVHYLYIG